MLHDILIQIQPFLIDLIVVLITAVIGIIGATVLKGRDLIIAKIGEKNFNRAIDVAEGIWYWIRDNHPEWTGEQKIEEMQAQLLRKYPSLSQIELDSINKKTHEWLKKITTPATPPEG